MVLKEINEKNSKAKRELEKLETKKLTIIKSRTKHKGENFIAFGICLKRGDLVTCIEKIGNHHVKNIFEFYNITKNGGFVANGHTVRTSMRNKYITVLFCFKEVININDCSKFRPSTEKERAVYEEALKNNGIK